MTVVDSCGKPRRKMACAKRRVRRKPKSRKCGSSRKKSRKAKKKCARPGPIIKNAFFNFLRDFRKKRCGKSMTSISKEAAKKWKCLSICKRSKYIKEACNAGGKCGMKKSRSRRRPKRRKRSMGARCAKKRRRPKKRKRVC